MRMKPFNSNEHLIRITSHIVLNAKKEKKKENNNTFVFYHIVSDYIWSSGLSISPNSITFTSYFLLIEK
jgi:hypothetical protein